MAHSPRWLPVLVLALGTLLVTAATARAGEVQAPTMTPQLTPLLVSATNAPLRVLGSDGREHLEYDLILTNVFFTPVTLSSIDVTAPDGSVLLHLAGDALTANTQQVLFLPIGTSTPVSQIPAGVAVATIIDLRRTARRGAGADQPPHHL
jgi:hypothetical protein